MMQHDNSNSTEYSPGILSIFGLLLIDQYGQTSQMHVTRLASYTTKAKNIQRQMSSSNDNCTIVTLIHMHEQSINLSNNSVLHFSIAKFSSGARRITAHKTWLALVRVAEVSIYH